MKDNVIERLRHMVVRDAIKLNTVKQCWPTWNPMIKNIIGENPTAQSILDIGDHLREIFQTTGTDERDQSAVSAGGTAWESIITWYINLCCIGSRVIAVKKMSQVPTPIRDAITVNYGSFSCTTEADITVIVFPDNPIFTEYNADLLKKNGEVDNKKLSLAVSPLFSNFEIGIIQCKTNWNDNSQIPMLWDMIYKAGTFRSRQISVGKNNFNIKALGNNEDIEDVGNGFTYSFVTVPSVKLSNFKDTSLPVKRVCNLSGGNYWGLESKSGVARSVKEIFQNYNRGYEHSDIRRTLSDSIQYLKEDLKYFQLYIEE